MNIKQMKSMVSRFRHADFSGVKDPVMRAKAQKLQAKQKGFTLLELLVVITLLAILATGALVAYDGVGENAQAARAASTAATLDQGVRAFRAVTYAYPDQWDNLADPQSADVAAGGADFIPEPLQQVLGSFDIGTAFSNVDVGFDLEDYFEDNFGMEEIQHIVGGANGLNVGLAPNRQHNEGANPYDGTAGAVETEYDDFAPGALVGSDDVTFISILASSAFDDNDPNARLACSVGGVPITRVWGNTDGNNTPGEATDIADPLVINSINDALSTERCNLVLALGFGGDAAHSTINSAAGVIQAPAYSSANVNPAENYARFVGLFHLARGDKGAAGGGDEVENLIATNFLTRPRLLGFIDTEGKPIDANVAEATVN